MYAAWYRMTWQVLLYLGYTFDHVKGANQDEEFWADDDPEERHAGVCFYVTIPGGKRRGARLWFGLSLDEYDNVHGQCEYDASEAEPENGPAERRPIWVCIDRHDPVLSNLWGALKQEFKNLPGALIIDSEESIGLEWPLSETATNADVIAAARDAADRINRAAANAKAVPGNAASDPAAS